MVKRFGEQVVTVVVQSRGLESHENRLIQSHPSDAVESMLEVRRALGCGGGRSAGGSERPRLRRSVESMLEVRRALGRGGGRSAGGSERPWLRRSVESMLEVQRALGRGCGRTAGGCSESPRSSQCWRFGEHWVVAVVGRQEVRRGLGCGGRSSQCWRFGEH